MSIRRRSRKIYEYINGDELTNSEIFEKLRGRFERIKSRSEQLNEIDVLEKEPNETWAGFIERFVLLARKCKINEVNQVKWIVKKLPDRLQTMLSTLRLAAIDISVEGIKNVLNTCQSRGIGFESISTLALNMGTEKIKRKRKIKKK